ncbi:ATP-binding protein [Streptomyces sp. NPDC002870]|uniref:ATP-binding protein n=1 Tax=Streptomyces sp. NPDC002870 TaxID=3364666 RepID=UPI0036C3D8FA
MQPRYPPSPGHRIQAALKPAITQPARRSALACCTLPTSEQAVSRARAFTKARLAAWRVGDEVADAARVIVSELVTNTIRHSGSPDVSIRLAHSCSTVRIEVLDKGLWRVPDQPRQGEDVAEGGRGLHLVGALSQLHGVHRTPTGTRVWALLPETPSGGLAETSTSP